MSFAQANLQINERLDPIRRFLPPKFLFFFFSVSRVVLTNGPGLRAQCACARGARLGRGETALVPVPPPPRLPGRLALASLWLLLRPRRWKAAIKPLGEGSRPQILFQVHLFRSPVPGSELVPEQSKQI